MKLWASLYAMIWLAFLVFLVILTPVGDRAVLVYGHAVLGVAVLVLAYYNSTELDKTAAPDRIKRIARSTFSLAVAAPILGVLLFVDLGATWVIPVVGISIRGIIELLHVVVVFAIITQVSSTATAYDMWEEKEFEEGSVGPPAPRVMPGQEASTE